jgi:quinol monooxygenase YgiN
MSQIAYVVKVTAVEGKRDEALTTMGKLVTEAGNEPGTLHYTMHADHADPNVIWFYEVYADQAAFEAHAGSATMAEVGGALGGLLAGVPEMHQLDIVQSTYGVDGA